MLATAVLGILVVLVLMRLKGSKGKAKAPKQFSYIVPGSAKPGHGEIHRGIESPEKLVDSIEGLPEIKTAYDNFQHGVKNNACRKLFGRRPVTNGGDAGPFEWLTYFQVDEMARAFGTGLIKENLIPAVADGMKPMAFYSKNRREWVIAEQGLFMYGGTTVPIYDTLGPDVFGHIINETGSACVLCAKTEVPKVLEAKAGCASLKAVVQMEPADASDKDAAKAKQLTLYGFDELVQIGKDTPTPVQPPKASDPATFCYTSGTTGMPKGVILTHANMIATLGGAFKRGMSTGPEDVHLSYLPLAHIFERMNMMNLMHGGGAVGFYQGDTLKITADLAELRPTVFPSVPRLLNKVYDKIVAGATASPVKKFLFTSGLNAKLANLRSTGTVTHAFWDKLLFSKIGKKVGLDRCRLMVTGSAPISAEVMDFLRVAFSTVVVEGYGQSETAAMGTLTDMRDLSSGHIGGPVPCVECKLVAVEDMGYLPTDTVHADGEVSIPCNGRGEICFRGPPVFGQYYKQPDKTKETIDSEGWCHTGDVGIWLPTGQLKIVDRKKNIFKLSQGEYVAAEKVENVYGTCPLVAQSFVYGDSLKSCLVAIVVPDEAPLMKWASENGKGGMDLASLCADAYVVKAVLAQMTQTGRAAKLKGFELAKAVHLTPELFAVENDLLTPTFKLKRHNAKLHFKAQIDMLYTMVG